MHGSTPFVRTYDTPNAWAAKADAKKPPKDSSPKHSYSSAASSKVKTTAGIRSKNAASADDIGDPSTPIKVQLVDTDSGHANIANHEREHFVRCVKIYTRAI